MAGSPNTPCCKVVSLLLLFYTLLVLISFDGRIALEIVSYISVLKVSLSFPHGHDYLHFPFGTVFQRGVRWLAWEGEAECTALAC